MNKQQEKHILKEAARLHAQKRWEKVSKKERSDYGRMMVEAREAKKAKALDKSK